jgi:acetyl esterase/lipase
LPYLFFGVYCFLFLLVIKSSKINVEGKLKMSESFNLWQGAFPGTQTTTPKITYYKPENNKSESAVIIFAGGAYTHRAYHEGEPYAKMLNSFGVSAFVVDYRTAPAHFPDQLLDARRAVRFVRKNAEKFGIKKDKIAVMGSSAGGHLAALVSTYKDKMSGEGTDETDRESPFPNAQILCYPVICSNEKISHSFSFKTLLCNKYSEREKYSPELICDDNTPPAFIWHTANDPAVNVENSLEYLSALTRCGVECELHVFPNGAHGLGLAENNPHVKKWPCLLHAWLSYVGFLE